MFDWTEARVEKAKRLWLQGFSAAQVANEMGDGLSRNAVIGKMIRLGVQRSRSTGTAQVFAPAPRKPPSDTKPAKPAAKAAPVAAPKIQASLPVERKTDGPVDLLNLPSWGCKWAVTSDNARAHLFCGKERDHSASYCREHAKRAAANPKSEPARS